MKIAFFFIFYVGISIGVCAQNDTSDVINHIITNRLLKTNGPTSIPAMILRSRTSEWDLPKDRVKSGILQIDDQHYTQLKAASVMDLGKIVTSQYKLIVSNLLPNDSVFLSKLDMFLWITLTTPVFFEQNTLCIIEIKGPDWREALLLKKTAGKWETMERVSGWIR